MRKILTILFSLFTSVTLLQAQITIGGNVYGGGNEGNTGGNTKVTIRTGQIKNVFGGARMADVGGRAFVNIDGEHGSGKILIGTVYGGNDIAGNVGKNVNPNDTLSVDQVPAELTDVIRGTETDEQKKGKNYINNSWNAFIRTSPMRTESPTGEDSDHCIFVGSVFGGGNGDYTYYDASGQPLRDSEGKYVAKSGDDIIATSDEPFNVPTIDKTYLEINGGCLSQVYGGGNAATVIKNTTISMNNPSKGLQSLYPAGTTIAQLMAQLANLSEFANISTFQGNYTSLDFTSSRVFGGNNKAEMRIRPVWNLQQGKIRDLYSGGNAGDMTNPQGLIMDVKPLNDDLLSIVNVYGGCRRADVRPTNDDNSTPSETAIQLPAELGYQFPAGLAARVIVRGGKVTNVYGGNDISGHVFGGNAVGIYTSISGDVYGGGNGSYAYTDNAALKDLTGYSDFYYNPQEVQAKERQYSGNSSFTLTSGFESVEALNIFRPHAEQVSVRLFGTKEKPTIIGGSVYVGGNCATLATTKQNPMVHLKVGSYVYADNVFLGNNGEGMVKAHEADLTDINRIQEGVLRTYKKTLGELDAEKFSGNATPYNTIDLTNATNFAKYMDGVVMELMPSVVFDSKDNGDPNDYEEYSTYFGSVYCGGNIGSMRCNGKTPINFQHEIVIFNKLVGGCNNANVASTDYNAVYEGGLLGQPDQDGNKLQLTLTGLKIQPRRWSDVNNKTPEGLIWNTVSASTGAAVAPVTTGLDASEAAPYTTDAADLDRRLTGGNIYGGCYNSGHVNGNVIINLEETVFDRDSVFDVVELDTESGEPKLYDNDSYKITKRNSGVILDEQGMDVLGAALNVFGGGYGKDSEIWGSTTINLKKGYTFQIFGGSERGVIGKPNDGEGVAYEFNGKTFKYNPKYSCIINVNGDYPGVHRGNANDNADMAEAEFIYGGGFLGPICGNTIINLGNGRVFNTFAGSCNADILGHTETYVGKNGFPYVRDYVYGGNDLGGRILGTANFQGRVRTTENGGYDAIGKVKNSDMLNASAYVEYLQGRVEKIFGGCYGVYDYKNSHYNDYFYATGATGTTTANEGKARSGFSKPWMDNAFVNFRPNLSNSPSNIVTQIYGAGEGYLGEQEENRMQNRSYILVDIPQSMSTFQNTEIFGGGQRGGVGMAVGHDIAAAASTAHKASAIIDLARGQIKAVYGGSYEEGVTRRTEVNVPAGSTIKLDKIFGGAYGTSNEYVCDVYEANVNWNSSDALVGNYQTGIYGGNNSFRRTLYSKVNINAPVWYSKTGNTENEAFATVYGAGYGKDTWSQYTEVNLNNTAQVYEVYGGGQLGRVMNKNSAAAWKAQAEAEASTAYTTEHAAWLALSDEDKATTPEPQAPKAINLDLDGYTDTGLDNDLAVTEYDGKKYNTNVRINQGAWVSGYMYNGTRSGAYAYGGGLGNSNTPNSGDVHGTTFIGLYGGKVEKDVYAAGTSGSVNNKYKVAKDDFNNDFIASANAYIEGGTARNVYGGGWRGSVGYHEGAITESTANDVLGETNVVIGKADGSTFVVGMPAIERNAYGGGEGGAVFGTTNITLNNGFIGYRYFAAKPSDNTRSYISAGGGYYQEKLDDETFNGDGTNRLYDSGCIFGGGYIDNSSVDNSHVKMYGGHVRNALFGGGEIAAVGRGVIVATGENNSERSLQGIYKAGHTEVALYEGHVHRNVFGGGRGYNNLGEGGTLYSDGYVFGQTEVRIHGGEIGNAELSANEDRNDNGNVFGGGDIGYVYSAYEKDGKLYVGIKDGKRYDGNYEGKYYVYKKGDDPYIPNDTIPSDTDPNWIKYDSSDEFVITEDCKVLIEPNARATAAVTINGHSYSAGDYVPISDLNTLGNKNDSQWDNLNEDGITIHNAVFAGGNTSSGSSTVFANATTVFGNATASIHDVYKRDLITIGSHHVGGLYGDGNLTFVDGYRGLNITNYGTDFYSIADNITKEEYDNLPPREQDYYELRYKCLVQCTDKEGKTYTVGSTISRDELITLFNGINLPGTSTPMVDNGIPNSTYWQENGVMSRYAGRPMNTIQRADFCGVWGSRMVMQGAQDRVPETVDYNNYTINRVREVSLNKKVSPHGNAEKEEKHKYHGNYFGIYNVVNFLGALSSDVDFNQDVRVTDNKDTERYQAAANGVEYGRATYEQWKKAHIKDRDRNNGNSHNQVALASGVYLELTSEEGRGTDLYEKKWGYVTGVIELDLINVQTGVGGGFVYAKNVHGVRSSSGMNHHTITELNDGAVSYKQFTYATDDSHKDEWQTSGNFVHSTQTIIDDCYNISAKYKGVEQPGGAVPAHYWYIKGSVYVYDQFISAYTGAPNAYSEQVEIPLTITAASHGTMQLLNIMPNKYAYYSVNTGDVKNKLAPDGKIKINEIEYGLNTPISYWDWYLLTPTEKALFVEDTYYVKEDCKIGNTEYTAGTVLLSSEYKAIRGTGATPPTVTQTKDVDGIMKDVEVDFDFIFRSSNNLSHDNGYILTYKLNNPEVWDNWYTKISSATHDKVSTSVAHPETQYNNGPTYYLNSGTGMLLGQREYKKSDVISKDVYDTYQSAATSHPDAVPTDSATFERAYIVTSQVTIPATASTEESRYYVGSTVSKTEAQTAPFSGKAVPAFICTHTVQLSPTEYIYMNTKMSEADKNAYLERFADDEALRSLISENIVPAYYCTAEGLYGGNYYSPGENYRGLEAWSSMSAEDRAHFTFNYDALDVLIDPSYSRNADGLIRDGLVEGKKYQYDSSDETLAGAEANLAHYSLQRPIDYTATYNGDVDLTVNQAVTVIGGTTPTNTIHPNDELIREEFERLPNEKRHYSAIVVKDQTTMYVVNTAFQVRSSPYTVGQIIESSAYESLTEDEQENVTVIDFTGQENNTFYYCREAYTRSNDSSAPALSGLSYGKGGSYGANAQVPVGVVIDQSAYNSLVNQQADFIIHGISPTEVSTLYVSRQSDIFDLSKTKIITVVYQYDYEETDSHGNITPVSERHVVNIHIDFKSGIPFVEDIKKPQTILPGTKLGLREPVVTSGAYEVTGGGWELFETIGDAESHINGIAYLPNIDQLYWYQNGYYVAYYAKTYLGKTYSNHEPIRVANYHDLTKVMADTDNHYYVDNPNVKRDPKIYITDWQNGAQQLKDFFDLSVHSTTEGVTDGKVTEAGNLQGHALLNEQVKSAANLDFIMHTNVEVPSGTAWTPIANNAGECFEGSLHGDGYYISGLTSSLFNHLCGSVYNLGVTGSFTGAGIAETGKGYVENCWVSTSSTATKTSMPVFGTPTRDNGYQIVNCYYQEEADATNKYTNHTGTYGIPTRMPAKAFYNGTVAYDLNGFYLYKRYNHGRKTSSGTKHTYYTVNAADGKLSEPQSAYYTSGDESYCSSSHQESYEHGGYVEDRYADGDFRYADGSIPETDDVRTYVNSENATNFYPIWPDDYIYFGQMLTYNWNDQRQHEDLPSHIYKSSGRLADNNQSNRVYRAPAYYRSKQMDVAHFNPAVNLVAYSKPLTQYDTNLKEAYPYMTAIDFNGHQEGHASSAYKKGFNDGFFYQPLLDDDGLVDIANRDETKNLLVYAPAETAAAAGDYANSKTYKVLNEYFSEPAYADYYQDDDYRRVLAAESSDVDGHLVQSSKTATNDHLLVDKQDFNCPIAYRFGSDYRMWYQRTPDRYVDLAKGWEGISIPFSAELVTTHEKGEITHFFSGSESSKNDTGTKLGHEYWLREFTGIKAHNTEASVDSAKFVYPTAGADGNKTVANTFLWDYYYEAASGHNRQDANTDTYQTYYNSPRTYNSYPLLANEKPYIIGFPGTRYYEFDLSGSFQASTTYSPTPAKLEKQVVTFAQSAGGNILVSDDAATGVAADGYTFVPNYLGKTLDPTAGSANYYTLQADGSSYKKLAAATSAVPFRPYFTAAAAAPARGNVRARSAEEIVFGKAATSFGITEHGDPTDGQLAEGMDIYAKKHKIVVTSKLSTAVEVRILGVSGICVANFTVEPGETVVTPIVTQGVYIVQPANGRYTKKLVVK